MNKNKLILVAVPLLLVFGVGFFINKNSQTSTITVVGQNKQDSPVGEVSFVVSKGNVGSDLNVTINVNEAQVNKLVSTVKEVGGPDTQISKGFYQVTPGDNQFVVANAFGVNIKNPSKLDALVRQLYFMGATSITNLSMSPANKDLVESDLRQKAVVDANKKATNIASSIGKSIKRIVSISDDQASPSSTVSPDGSSNQSIISLSKNVTIVYEIW